MKKTSSAGALPFTFSSYVLTNPLGSSLNHLGIASAQSQLARLLLPQFTVATSKPRYHALLCGILYCLQELDIPVNSLNVRKCEILWGLSQTLLIQEKEEDVTVPLNIRRYNSILKTFLETRRPPNLGDTLTTRTNILKRLTYGVWGFYVNPSVEWRLINENLKSLRAPLGTDLGTAFAEETGLFPLVKKWLGGRNVSLTELREFGLKANLSGERGRAEVKAWANVLGRYLKDFEKIKPERTKIWDYIPEVYKKTGEPSIDLILKAQDHFSGTAMWIEFTFELVYLKAECRSSANIKKEDQNYIFEECQREVKAFENTLVFAKTPHVFKLVSKAKNFSDMEKLILEAHNLVQIAKNKSPYVTREGKLVQSDALNCDRSLRILPELGGSSLRAEKNVVKKLYGRDWHFPRAAIYKESFE